MNDEGKAALSGTCIGDLTTAVVSCMGRPAGRGRNPTGTRTSLPKAISAITLDVMPQYYNSGTRRSRPPRARNVCVMAPRFHSFAPRETPYFALLAPVEERVAAKDPAWREKRPVTFNPPFAPGLSMETLSKPPQYQPPPMPTRDAGGRDPVQRPWRTEGARPGRHDTAARIGAHRPDDAAATFSPEMLPVPPEGGGPHPYSPMVTTS